MKMYQIRRKVFLRSIVLILSMVGLMGCGHVVEKNNTQNLQTSAASQVDIPTFCIDEKACNGQVAIVRGQTQVAGMGGVDTQGRLLRTQWSDLDGDGTADTAFIELLGATPSIRFEGTSSSSGVRRTAVILSERIGGVRDGDILTGGEFVDVEEFVAPEWHKVGNRLLRFEGPTWETDLVAYRLYLDERNGTDIFGKTLAQPVMHKAGYDGDNYHELSDWGADVLKVGDSLGIGALGLVTDDGARRVHAQGGISAIVLDNGPLFSRFSVSSTGWDVGDQVVNIETEYAIKAGSRLSHVSMTADKPVENLATGIVRHEDAEFFSSVGLGKSDKITKWSYIATFGMQSVFSDALGMAVFYRTQDADIIIDDPLNYAVGFKGARDNIDYYFSAVWEEDISAIKTKEQFLTYLDKELENLNNPLVID